MVQRGFSVSWTSSTRQWPSSSTRLMRMSGGSPKFVKVARMSACVAVCDTGVILRSLSFQSWPSDPADHALRRFLLVFVDQVLEAPAVKIGELGLALLVASIDRFDQRHRIAVSLWRGRRGAERESEKEEGDDTHLNSRGALRVASAKVSTVTFRVQTR